MTIVDEDNVFNELQREGQVLLSTRLVLFQQLLKINLVCFTSPGTGYALDCILDIDLIEQCFGRLFLEHFGFNYILFFIFRFHSVFKSSYFVR